MRALWATVVLGARHRFAYRVEVLTTVVAAILLVLLNGSLWSAVAGEGQVAGMGAHELTTYVAVVWVLMAVGGSRLDEHLDERFRSGQIAMDLLKPMSLQSFLIGRHLGGAAVAAVLVGLPVGLVASLLFPVLLPPSPLVALATLASVALAAVVSGHLAFLVGLLAIRLKSASGAAHLKATLVGLLSGAVIPLDTLPDLVRPVALALPFQAMAHLPATLWLGRWQGLEMAQPLAIQLAWVVALYLACRLAWSRTVHHMTVQGG